MRFISVLPFVLVAVSLSACADGSVRSGPYVDAVEAAPFLTHAGAHPAQNEAQAAVEAAIKRDGYRAVFPAFGAISPDRMPTYLRCSPARRMALGREQPSVTIWKPSRAIPT